MSLLFIYLAIFCFGDKYFIKQVKNRRIIKIVNQKSNTNIRNKSL